MIYCNYGYYGCKGDMADLDDGNYVKNFNIIKVNINIKINLIHSNCIYSNIDNRWQQSTS